MDDQNQVFTQQKLQKQIDLFLNRARCQLDSLLQGPSEPSLEHDDWLKLKMNLELTKPLLSEYSKQLSSDQQDDETVQQFNSFSKQVDELLPFPLSKSSSPKVEVVKEESEDEIDIQESCVSDTAELDSNPPVPTLTFEPEDPESWIESIRKRAIVTKKAEERAGIASDNVGEETSEELARHEQIQDELAGSLVNMAEVLKSNTVAFGQVLQKDGQVLDEAQLSLNSNLDRLTAEGRRLNLISKSTSVSTVMYYFAVVLVMLIFVMTALFIRLTPKLR